MILEPGGDYRRISANRSRGRRVSSALPPSALPVRSRRPDRQPSSLRCDRSGWAPRPPGRNKVIVVDAYFDLIPKGVARPTVAEVADHSGLSHRSVFRYFADKDDMARTSIDFHQARVARVLEVRIEGGRSPVAASSSSG